MSDDEPKIRRIISRDIADTTGFDGPTAPIGQFAGWVEKNLWILQMPPSNDLDAFVAEFVMGCTLSWSEDLNRGFHCACKSQEHEELDDDGMTSWLKEYSTDIGAAWEVVEKLSTKYTFEIHSNGDPWIAAFSQFTANGETAAHAICLAAFASVDQSTKQSSMIK
jgi:hypothetical protein